MVLFILLILTASQYVAPALAASASYVPVGPEGPIEYREEFMLSDAVELLRALNATYASLSLSEARIADLSERLETLYLRLFPSGTFHDLELFLVRMNDELKLNLTRTDIKAFVNKFLGKLGEAKAQLVKGFGRDVPIPATPLIYTPTREESAPYLHGRSLLAFIMVDDASLRIPWNRVSEAILRRTMGMVMEYLKCKAPKEAKVSFSGRIYHARVSSPINTNVWPPDESWMDEAARSLGYNGVHDMARRLKDEAGVDNVVLVFVPHKSSLLYGGYALPAPYWGYGERACVHFFLVDLFGIGVPSPFSVYVHEILHLFGAADEYPYDHPQPWNAYPPLGDLWPNTSPGWPLRVCVMCDPLLYWFSICKETRGQIGWNDYDGDGVLDPIDPDPKTPNRPWEWVFDVPAHSVREVDVEINLTDVMVVGNFAPLIYTFTYPPPYVNFLVKDPSGNSIIQAREVLNYSFSFSPSTAGTYRFIFEDPTDTPIPRMELRLALIAKSPLLAEVGLPRIFSVNLTIRDQSGRTLSGVPVLLVSSTAEYSSLQLTNLNGELDLWLPEGVYSVRVTYMNSTILDTRIDVNSNCSKTFYVEVVAPIEEGEMEVIPEGLKVGEIPPKHVTLSSKGFGYCNYSDDLVSIDLRSLKPELYPGDVLVIKMRVEAKDYVHFNHLRLYVYSVKEVRGEYVGYPIGNLTLMSGVDLASGVLRVEDFELAIPSEASPGQVYSVVSAVFAKGEKAGGGVVVLLPATHLYDVFTIAYLRNRAYEDLQKGYEELQREVESMRSKLNDLRRDYDDLKAKYESSVKLLEAKINELKIKTGLMCLFIATTIALTATTVYFARRKPKAETLPSKSEAFVQARLV